MQETHDSSSRKPLTVEQLLQFKRLERPNPDFWVSFEQELKQKQLRALVKPSRWQRVRLLLTPRVALLAPLSAAAGLALFTIVPNSRVADSASPFDLAHVSAPIEHGDPYLAQVSSDIDVTPVARVTPRRTDAVFVDDALVPEVRSSGAFRTIAVPETLVAARDASSYYVVNAFTAGAPGLISIPEGVLEF
jgi:hypothetical protein